LGTKVRIVTKNDKAGKIEIDYYSLDDLDRICGLLNGKSDSNSVGTAPWLKTKFTV
jgi:ParB family chromosome partitioning protein